MERWEICLVAFDNTVIHLDAESNVVVRCYSKFGAVRRKRSLAWLLRFTKWRRGANRVRIANTHDSLLTPEIKGGQLVRPERGFHAQFFLGQFVLGFFFSVVFWVNENLFVVKDALEFQPIIGNLIAVACNVHSFSTADHLERTCGSRQSGTSIAIDGTIEKRRRSKDSPFSLEFFSFFEDIFVVGFELVLVVSDPSFFSHCFHPFFRATSIEEFVAQPHIDLVLGIVVIHKFKIGIVGIRVRIFWFLFIVGRGHQRTRSVDLRRLGEDWSRSE
mmetsp:Transcript_3581/g.8548  ORF Transcript_3581/g.8548 Transcript_3581/m.8548 type:complete len:274 (-) Transcript_3581:64-885(-)